MSRHRQRIAWPPEIVGSIDRTRRDARGNAAGRARRARHRRARARACLASSGLLDPRAATGGHLRVGPEQHAGRALRRPARRAPDVGADHRPGTRVSPRPALVAAVPRRRRGRCARARLLLGLFRRRRAGAGALRRLPARLRRRHARPGHQRRPPRALSLLGGHHGALLPAHRAPPRERFEPHGRHPGARRDDLRRPGDARRAHHRGGAGRHLPAQRGSRRPRGPPADERRPRGAGGRRPHPARRPDEVGARAVPLLAARCHGRADPRQRLPARRGHGQGRHLPRRALRPRVCRGAAVAAARARARRHDHGARRLPLAAAVRPQAAARLRHREPARLPDDPRRLGHPRRRSGGRRDAARPRALQVVPLPRRGHHRPHRRHARPARALRDRPPGAVARRGRVPRCRVDGRPAAAARLRRQGGRLRRLRRRRAGLGAMGARGARARLGGHVRLHGPVRLGRLRRQARPQAPAHARPPARCSRACRCCSAPSAW